MSKLAFKVQLTHAVLVIFLAGPGVVSAQSLGRLFSTVEQRLELDEVRDEYEYGKPQPHPKPLKHEIRMRLSGRIFFRSR